MTQKWNLQDIRPAEVRKPRRPEAVNKAVKSPVKQVNPNDDVGTIVIKDGNKSNRTGIIVGIVAVLVLIAGIFGLTAILSKTTLTVVPVSKQPNVNAEFTAYPDHREAELSYEIMTLESTGERQVTATGQQEVEEQAKGYVNIVKTTPGSERLIKNTRFRSPDGLIFRIQESVVVPGAVKGGDGALTPGSIRAEVFADDVGQQYNLAAGTRFDIPGFKENNLDELYKAIYAENSETFTGGFKGPRFIIDDNELATARQSLQMELRDGLLARIESEKPAGFIAFPDAVTFTYNELPAVQYGDNLVTIREQATLQIPLFAKADFASFMAAETITTYSGEAVQIRNIDEIRFGYTDENTSSINIANEPSLSFKIIGRPLIVWDYDVNQLQEDLSGKSFTAITTVLTAYPGIANGKITEKPFWKRSFPSEPDDISVVEQLEVK
ncbi:MAG: hypothetical protein H6779_00605 [Candidatus Nomurabacteria bacterium]|nr:hypothetical protein [Candidatus Nomurabacteria bacterium]USN87930.1 MAG: hypothetical protein H6779_00605 [Candidatus Nomurabacteria bacterium]